MAEQAFDDNDPTVYSSHVLYVKKGDGNCTQLLSRLTNAVPLMEHVFIQEVNATSSQRPAWLRGVPTLYVRNEERVITGTQNIWEYASTWINTDPMSSSSLSSLGGGSLNDTAMFSIEGDSTPAITTSSNMGERGRRKAANAASVNSAVEALQNARASMDRNVHASLNRGRIPPPRNVMNQ